MKVVAYITDLALQASVATSVREAAPNSPFSLPSISSFRYFPPAPLLSSSTSKPRASAGRPWCHRSKTLTLPFRLSPVRRKDERTCWQKGSGPAPTRCFPTHDSATSFPRSWQTPTETDLRVEPAPREAHDWIEIRGIRCQGRVGVGKEERSAEQRLEIDLRLGLDLQAAVETDDIRSTVDYATVVRQVQQVVAREPAILIERVAARVSDLLLAEDRVLTVTVRVRKFPVDLRDDCRVGCGGADASPRTWFVLK